MNARPLLSLALVAGLLPLTLTVPPAAAAVPAMPFVSELHYDNSGTDTGEFVEVHLPPGTSTQGWSVVLYNGSNGATYGTKEAPSVTAPADRPAVAVVDYPSNGIQNGSPDALALVDAAGDLVEFLSYEGVVTAVGGPASGTTSTDIGVAESGSGSAGESLSRTYDAVSDTLVWTGPGPSSRRQVNPSSIGPGGEEPARPCDTAPTHEIGAVQGSGGASPLAGQQVSVRGVVVGDVPGLSGFYLQDADGDGDASTSDGIFVFSPLDVALGDTVQAIGGASERFGQTQLSSADQSQVCRSGSPADLPAAAVLDLPADDAGRERLEGMLVSPADVLTVSEVFDLTSFGELLLSEGGVLVQPTEVARPGQEADAVAAQNVVRSIVLDDGRTARTSATNRPYLSPDTPVRVGDQLTFASPLVLGYGFGAWRLQPADGTAEDTLAGQNTRPAAPEPVVGDVTVGSFNVLNYFLTLEAPGRGARDPAALERQAAKIVIAIEALGADVVALQEVEDSDSTGLEPGNADIALADLVGRLNDAAGYDKWAFPSFPQELLAVERDVIRNAVIYRRDVVEPLGPSVGLVDEENFDNAREPIAQTFTKDGDAFTVVANHFKSKRSNDATGDNVDTGQGGYNGDRVRQAQALAAFTEQLRRQSGDDDVLVIGDLNSYTQEDPIEVLREAGFSDLGERLDPGRYSYVFDGRSGSLDHAMATAPLTAKVTGLAHWSINSVESFSYQYNGDRALYAENPFRSSDHDPLVLGIDLQERCAGLLPTIVGTAGDDVLRAGNGRDVVMGLGGDDVLMGGNGDDVLCGGPGSDRLGGGDGADVLLGGFGNDVLAGDRGDDVLTGGPGSDRLDGGRGADDETQDGAAS